MTKTITITKTMIAAGLAAVAVAGCGSKTIDTDALAKQIKPELSSELGAYDASVHVAGVDCMAKSQTDANCLGYVNSDTGPFKVAIHVDVDPSSGKFIWKVQS